LEIRQDCLRHRRWLGRLIQHLRPRLLCLLRMQGL
jgi:hypothetical protein